VHAYIVLRRYCENWKPQAIIVYKDSKTLISQSGVQDTFDSYKFLPNFSFIGQVVLEISCLIENTTVFNIEYRQTMCIGIPTNYIHSYIQTHTNTETNILYIA